MWKPGSPFHCVKHLILCCSPHTLAGSHNTTSTLKNLPWLHTWKSKRPFENTPPHDVRNATDQAENWLQLLSLLLFSVSVLKTNIHFPFNENITPICIPSSCVITNADTSQIKIKQWSRCWPSVTPAAAAAAAAAFHYTPTPPPPPPPHKLTQAGYTPPSHSDKEQLCERQTMASDTDTTQR